MRPKKFQNAGIKTANFYDICQKNAGILHDNCPKIFFTKFWGHVPHLSPHLIKTFADCKNILVAIAPPNGEF